MIEVLNKQKKNRINRRKFRSLLERLSRYYGLSDPEIALGFVGTRAIKELNRKFMRKDAPTDVLSFPLGEKGADGKFYLGDIIICTPQALKQSARLSHSLERELEYLTIHGFLHLLGFEHFKGFEEEEMKVRNIFIRG
ncbi:MAG: rRNA maturation RNase YbeY [Candidatus Aminicenantales bacterium]